MMRPQLAFTLPLALVGAALFASPASAQAPPEWTCSASFYEDGDFCDCECGAYDPDCADETNTVFGCTGEQDGCNLLGTCRDVPTEWTCVADWYDAGDSWCDCDCGAYDPDCDRDTTLSGCPAGADSCNPDGTCHVVPAAWTCNDAYFDDGTLCDCECGAYDVDCDDPDATIFGCPAGTESCNPDGSCHVVPAEWTCDESYFDAGDGCDCACGAFDPDCDDPAATLYNCPTGATGCNADGTCSMVPETWTCSDTFYDDGTLCDCACGAPDPDCADVGNTVLGCPTGSFGCNVDGTCDLTPPDWTCSDSFYDDGTFCDCECGAPDPDCADASNTVIGCPAGAFGCLADGTCDLTPPDWTCNDSWYLDGSFCDCECGAYDPDCDDAGNTLFGCPNGATGCSEVGECVIPPTVPPAWFCNPANFDGGDGCDCACGAHDPDCDDGGALYGCPQGSEGCKADGTCLEPVGGPPPTWECSATFYDAADGCDCNCGAPDPDCALPDQTLYGCPAEATGCTIDGECIEPVDPVVPPGWTCAPATYDAADGCHCECGVYDPDCDAPAQQLLNCPGDAIGCSMDAECRIPVCTPSCSGKECGGDGCGGTCGTCSAQETCTANQCVANEPDVVPPTWTCAPAAYGDDVTCNCACGAADPDCANGSLPVTGCAQGLGCTAAGVCEEPEGPAAWTCEPSYYNAADGCDCGCGAYDPDCDIPDAEVYGCTQGAEGCSADGECIGGAAPPPEGWTCGATLYNAADGCDCACGIYDPDCALPDQQIYGCTQDAIGCNAQGACVEPACVPSCVNLECGDDGCGGTCGTCGANEACSPAGQCEGGDPEPDASPDPEPGVEPDPSPDPEVPAGWTCADASYAASDGCHCGCGIYDPDCSDTGAAIVGCSSDATGCDLEGKCIEPDCADGCAGRECGTDTCGMVCGICDASDFCSAEGTCLPRVVEEDEPDAGRTDGDGGGNMSGCAACGDDARWPVEVALLLGLSVLLVRRRRR